MTPDSDDLSQTSTSPSADAVDRPSDPASDDEGTPEVAEQEETPPAPLLELRDGLPPLTETPPALVDACAALAAAAGPVAIDAERASGYRYSSRAYLIQLRREGAGTFLVDPIGFDSLAPLQDALAGSEWILHAATQDLPCLTEVGLVPSELFDTELAGRLLGYPRVGLATLVETLLGFRMKKEHSAADWSTRPLPTPWLDYAALDVEVLIELRDVLAEQLREAGKDEWARQEFDALRGFTPAQRIEPWRRTSGLHRVRGRRLLAAVRELWEARDELARSRDVSPGRILGDNAIVAAALADPATRADLLAAKGFHGRGAQRYAERWLDALSRARGLPEEALPVRAPRTDGPPSPRAWAERDPVAAERLVVAREGMARLSEEHDVPAENLLAPDTVRRVMWEPAGSDETAVATQLRELGAREWQVALTASMLAEAVVSAQPD
ncbi:MAG TPA: HRDC domain-containing protein [Nocardioides sp.]|jgi:ribonuclease D|uniref:HRDC domain-containing protein n=1 Tax=Nocardioides sp. TaxID=35761 RepID=UPI002E3300B8|nr:HRDC domain-containing protein [Nocardioides sp.]HEX3930082.1 HRDC domain-containing protein [Nocardioides sp.]